MKAIIPVAGVGVKLRPHTYTQPKPLMPVAGKPILGYIVDELIDAGFDEFIFVIGYLGEKIEAYIKHAYPDVKAHFVVQNHREGLGHAIWLGRELVEPNEEVFIALGDTIFEVDLKKVLASEHSSLGVKKVDDPRAFGVAEFDDDGFINKVEEKPLIPKSNRALVGLYRIKESTQLFETLTRIIEQKQKTQGEFHLTDAIMEMINDGVRFTDFKVDNWYDCGKKDILLETNAVMLKKNGMATEVSLSSENSIIVPPVHIPASCKVTNSIIGPNVTLGEHSEIDHAIITESIIGNYSKLNEVVLKRSVVGSDSIIHGTGKSLNLGDNAEIEVL